MVSMDQDSVKLLRELKFIEDSFKSGIITKSEFETARKRVEDKLALVKKEEAELEESAEIRKKQEEIKQAIKPEPIRIREQEKPKKKTEVYYEDKPKIIKKEPQISPKKPSLHLETYGKKIGIPKKTVSLIIISAILLIIIAFFSFKPAKMPEERFIPLCSTDLDCQKSGFIGKCFNASAKNAKCIFEPAALANITIIDSEECALCDIKRMKNSLSQLYPGANYRLLDAGESEAEALISKLNIEALPAYIFDNSVEKTTRFESTKSALIKINDLYLMKPAASGSSYFFKKKEKDTVELFINPFASSSRKAFDNLLKLAKKHVIDFNIRFYTRKTPGDAELDEILRQICIRDYSKTKLVSYLQCAFEDEIAETCMDKYNLPSERIESCMEKKGLSLLNKDIELAEEFSINTVPVFIFSNQYKKGGSLSVDILGDVFCRVNPKIC